MQRWERPGRAGLTHARGLQVTWNKSTSNQSLLHSVTLSWGAPHSQREQGNAAPQCVPPALLHLRWGWDTLCSQWEWGDTVPQHYANCALSSVPALPGWDQDAPCSSWNSGDTAPSLLRFVTCAQPGLGCSTFPPGLCVRARVRGLFAISSGAACGRARCQPQAGKGGAGAAGARAGERSPASGCGSGSGEVAAAQPGPGGQHTLGTRGHGPAMARLLPLLLLVALSCAARPGRRPAAWDDGADGNFQPSAPLFCSGPPSHRAAGMEKGLTGQLAGWGVLSRAGGVPGEGLGEAPAPGGLLVVPARPLQPRDPRRGAAPT